MSMVTRNLRESP